MKTTSHNEFTNNVTSLYSFQSFNVMTTRIYHKIFKLSHSTLPFIIKTVYVWSPNRITLKDMVPWPSWFLLLMTLNSLFTYFSILRTLSTSFSPHGFPPHIIPRFLGRPQEHSQGEATTRTSNLRVISDTIAEMFNSLKRTSSTFNRGNRSRK